MEISQPRSSKLIKKVEIESVSYSSLTIKLQSLFEIDIVRYTMLHPLWL